MRKLKLALVIPTIALIASCSKDTNEIDELGISVTENEITSGSEMVEVASPEPGEVVEIYFGGHQIPVEKLDQDYVYQGDILLPPNMVSPQKQKLIFEKGEVIPQNKSVGRTSGRWPNNTVYYSVDSGLSSKNRVYDAITHWESKTNLKFVERTSQSNYIYFVSGSGCSSYIGMIGGRQNVTLSNSCSTGNAIHEIGHAIGLWHEQSRVDREQFITINYGNIQSGREHNFHTYSQMGMDGDEFTNSLDFSSIMMYGSYSFSDNGKPTMVRKDGSTFNVQRYQLSTGDVSGINNMYPYNAGREPAPEIYVNGTTYYIGGLTVLRSHDYWYFRTIYGWKRVRLMNDRWYWV